MLTNFFVGKSEFMVFTLKSNGRGDLKAAYNIIHPDFCLDFFRAFQIFAENLICTKQAFLGVMNSKMRGRNVNGCKNAAKCRFGKKIFLLYICTKVKGGLCSPPFFYDLPPENLLKGRKFFFLRRKKFLWRKTFFFLRRKISLKSREVFIQSLTF